MARTCIAALVLGIFLAGCAGSGAVVDDSPPAAAAAPATGGPGLHAETLSAEEEPDGQEAAEEGEDEGAEEEGHSFGTALLLYLPNRLFDLLDVVRARVRVGPGLAVDARVTELADVYAGAYTSAFVGIPGPRREPKINWPVGGESRAGVEISEIVTDKPKDDNEPRYDPLEIGFGAQILIIGFAVGLAPIEIVDFITGLVGIDIVGDDL